jgi:hypothetical protein
VGSIILNIDGSKAVDVETVSRLMSNKDDSQGTSVQLILKNGQIMRIII